eukprot:CAMPEP_0172482032 /NCGR_PEP_ID=MMETSP1066-20121228/8318_1 /TAXON_ID=671091 /ORGANISM="Coscinodiscus wailesii, Strain CCMP2513" /LENGTH=90 /DNA_ID=CAMNT_0013244897 /DNA_START=134 /DNA_END=403 /DNA_ORIENTATION=+
MKSLCFLGIALVMLTCLAWSPADATLFNTEVPKTNTFYESILSLIGTDRINTEHGIPEFVPVQYVYSDGKTAKTDNEGTLYVEKNVPYKI